MLRQAAAVYTSDLDRYSQASDANEAGSIALLKNKHPYFSPALGECFCLLSLQHY